LTGHAFPLAQVHHRVEHFFKIGVIRRKPGMEILGSIRVGIDAGVVGGEFFHFVEAMIRRIGNRLVAHVPLAGKVGGVAVLLEKLSNRWSLWAEIVLVSRGNHDRERGTNGNASGHERGAAAVCAAICAPPLASKKLEMASAPRAAFLTFAPKSILTSNYVLVIGPGGASYDSTAE